MNWRPFIEPFESFAHPAGIGVGAERMRPERCRENAPLM
jgi:hypothetical protein